MPIDHERNLLFVHIPKTGGSTILSLLGLWRARRDADLQILFGDFGPYDLQHLTMAQLREFLTAAEISQFYSFAFVRNPWARAVSAALWRRRFEGEGVRDLRDYVEWAERVNRGGVRRKADCHALPQSAFVVREGVVAVDFLGRFERFEADVAACLGRFMTLPAVLPHKLRNDAARHYREFYGGDLRARVGALYAEDVLRFGYEF